MAKLQCKICGGYPGNVTKPRERLFQCKNCGTLVCDQHLKMNGLMELACPACGANAKSLKTVMGGGVGVVKAKYKAEKLESKHHIGEGAGGSVGLGGFSGGGRSAPKRDADSKGLSAEDIGMGSSQIGSKYMDSMFGARQNSVVNVSEPASVEEKNPLLEALAGVDKCKPMLANDGGDIDLEQLAELIAKGKKTGKKVEIFNDSVCDSCLIVKSREGVGRCEQEMQAAAKDTLSVFAIDADSSFVGRWERAIEGNAKAFGAVGLSHKAIIGARVPSLNGLMKIMANNANYIAAVGVASLDFEFSAFNKNEQIELLEKQIEIAHGVNLPILIKQKGAEAELMALLQRVKPQTPWIMTSVCNDENLFNAWVGAGNIFAVGAEATYESAAGFQKQLSKIPGTQFLLMSGDEMIAPKSLSGEYNSPKYVVETAESIASILGVSAQNLLRLAHGNFLNVYSWVAKQS